jgi:Macoilin family
LKKLKNSKLRQPTSNASRLNFFSFYSRINDLQMQERRNRQFFDSQLNQEKKLRKQAEDKANTARCSESCKMKKMQLESENNKLRRELNLTEETKQNLEKQNRMYEHEVSDCASH